MSAPPINVLVVEDDPRMRAFLTALLGSHGYRVHTADGGASGLREATMRNPDVYLIDLGLPEHDGFWLTERLREWTRAPILVVSARGVESDKVRALDLGADDYLTKPFGSEELLARLRVALRHAAARAGEAGPVYTHGRLQVDLARRQVTLAGERLDLTPTEYKLLALFCAQAGRVLTHDYILREVWGPGAGRQAHYVRVYVAQLRRKIEVDPSTPALLLTETGVGYRFVEAAGEEGGGA